MSTAQNWWHAWAPYWEHLEDRHLSIYTTRGMEPHIQSPVLIVGAGQGLIVEYLRKRGHRVDGIDLETAMLEWALKRRGLELTRADARDLPFKDAVYQTVIIASGVADYQTDTAEVQAIITEGKRVLGDGGTLLVAFHQVAPSVLKIYRKIGVVRGDIFYLRRIFEISLRVKENPLSCVKLVAGWTGQSYLKAFAYWTKLGLTLPRELREESEKVSEIFRQAAGDQVSADQLYRCVPEEIPLRDSREIRQLLLDLSIRNYSMHKSDDCLVVIHPKTPQAMRNSGSPPTQRPGGKPRDQGEDFLIETRDLTKRYKGVAPPAVDRLNLSIERGTVFGILGPNGAGKTTTLMMLCGLLRPDDGEILFRDLSADRFPRRKQKKTLIGYVPQELALYPKLSGRDNLLFFGRLYKMGRDLLKNRSDELLEMTGLAARADDLVGTYSTGMKRRLNLVVGMLHSPDIVLMDEPTVGIDPQSRNRIYDTILSLRKSGVTILYTTHYMEEASRLCDRIAIIDSGTVLLEGIPEQIVVQHGATVLKYEVLSHQSKSDSFSLNFREFVAKIKDFSGVKEVSTGEISTSGGKLKVTVKNPNGTISQLKCIEDLAKQRNIELRLKNVIEANLESLFLDLTGRRLRDSFDEGY